MLGYCIEQKAYKLWNIEKQAVIFSRNVTFNEKSPSLPWIANITEQLSNHDHLHQIIIQLPAEEFPIIKMPNEQTLNDNAAAELDEDEFVPLQDDEESDEASLGEIPNQNTNNELTNSNNNQRKSARTRTQTLFYNPSAMLLCAEIHIGEMKTRSEPNTYLEALNSEYPDEWQLASIDEIQSMIVNNVFTLVDRPKDKKVIRGRWVYRIKENPDGTINKFKARYVAKGYEQKYGFDCLEVSSPVMTGISLKTLASLANSKGWRIRQDDFITAFLNSPLKEEVFLEQPEGFKDINKPNGV